MRLNNKGFAISSIMYLILVMAIILITVILGILSSRKLILDKLKIEVLQDIYSSESIVEICEAVTSETVTVGNVPSGNYETGDEYICNVDGVNEYHFFVLSTEDDSVNLIMANTLVSASWLSTTNYTSAGGSGGSAENSYGPITAMNALHSATKNWINISNIIINYTDESGIYGGIKTSGTTTSITKTTGTVTATYENLKARMPSKTELYAVGCDPSNCPYWISANLTSGSYYWLSTSYSGSGYTNYAYNYYSSPNQVYYSSITSSNGIRPVISVAKSDIKENEPRCTAVTSETVTVGNVPSGSYAAGDEYICNVDGTNEYHFFILSKDGDTVNLISSTSVGSSSWISASDYTTAGGTNSTTSGEIADRGPVTAMNYLYDATKDWLYVPNISINWDDDERGTYDGTESGYGGFSTSGNKVSIIAQDGTVTATYEKLKTRLPNKTELSNAGCTEYGSCPTWLYNNETYWTASSAAYGGSYNVAWAVYSSGFGFYNPTNSQNIRPVISVTTSDLG